MTIELDVKKRWFRNIRRVKSPNCDKRPARTRISLVVIHGISLPPGQYGGGYIDQLFTNKLDPDHHPYFQEIAGLRVSAHLLIARSGTVTQYVPFNQRAWHAGRSSFQDCEDCNNFSIGIELEGCDDEPYENVQYLQLVNIIRAIVKGWPAVSRDRIVGHCHIAPGRKTDPGPAFDWEYFYKLLD